MKISQVSHMGSAIDSILSRGGALDAIQTKTGRRDCNRPNRVPSVEHVTIAREPDAAEANVIISAHSEHHWRVTRSQPDRLILTGAVSAKTKLSTLSGQHRPRAHTIIRRVAQSFRCDARHRVCGGLRGRNCHTYHRY